MAFASKSITFQVTDAPPFLAGMSAYQSRVLTGSTYGPVSGLETMQSVTPSEWITSDPGTSNGFPGVVIAWSGGFKGIDGGVLMPHGGGHNDSANNGAYEYVLGGGSRPSGFVTPLVISPVSAVRAANATYTDGKPTSIHTYDGCVYAHHNDCAYRFGGAWYNPPGNLYSGSAKYNRATRTWSYPPNYPGGGDIACKTFYNPTARKIFVMATNSGTGYFFRCDDDTWSAGKAIPGGGVDFDLSASVNTNDGSGLLIGQGVCRIFTFDWNAETIGGGSVSPTGATAAVSLRGPSVYYAPWLNDWFIWGGGASGTNAWPTMYRMNGTTRNITANTITGTAIPTSFQIGSYGRFGALPSQKVVVMFGSHNQPPAVVKLPDT